MKRFVVIFFYFLVLGCASHTQSLHEKRNEKFSDWPVVTRFYKWSETSSSPFSTLLKTALDNNSLRIQPVDKARAAWPFLFGGSVVEDRSFSTVHLDTSDASSARNLNVEFRNKMDQSLRLSRNYFWLFVSFENSDQNFVTFVHELSHVYFQIYLDNHAKRLMKSFETLFVSSKEGKFTIEPDTYDYLSEFFARMAEFSVICDWRAKGGATPAFSKEFEYLNSTSWTDVKSRISDYLVQTYKIPESTARKWKDSPLFSDMLNGQNLSTDQCPNVASPSTR